VPLGLSESGKIYQLDFPKAGKHKCISYYYCCIRTVKDWNSLEVEDLDNIDLETFKNYLNCTVH